MKKRIVLLCKKLYFSLPSIKYDPGSHWHYYDKILGILVNPKLRELNRPKWCTPLIWKISSWIDGKLFFFMVKNKEILNEEHLRKREEMLKKGIYIV